MSSPGFVVMQANNAVTNRTFSIEGVKPPFSQQLYQLYKPYGYTHGHLASFARDRKELFERNCVPVLWHLKRKCIEEFNVASVWVTGPGFCTAFARKYQTALMPDRDGT